MYRIEFEKSISTEQKWTNQYSADWLTREPN